MSRRAWNAAEVVSIFNRTKGMCYLCRKVIVWDGEEDRSNIWHIEHVIAFAEGEKYDVLGNLLPACAGCNLAKSNTHLAEFIKENKEYTVATFALQVSGLSDETRKRLEDAKEVARSNKTLIAEGREIFRISEDERDLFFQLVDAMVPVPMQIGELAQPCERPDGLELYKEEIGKGGDGSVCRAILKTAGVGIIQVAVKSMPIARFEQEQKNQRREISLLRFFSCLQVIGEEFVVPYFGDFIENGRIHVLMLWAPSTLKMVLENPIESIVGADFVLWGSQISRAVAVLHSAGVEGELHRDLKPENILILSTKKAVLGDFSRSRSYSLGSTLTDNKAGWNNLYPEVSGTVDAFQSECFALCYILNEMGDRYGNTQERTVLKSFAVVCGTNPKMPLGSGSQWYTAKRMHYALATYVEQRKKVAGVCFPVQLQALCSRLYDDLSLTTVEQHPHIQDIRSRLETVSRNMECAGVIAIRGETQVGKSTLLANLLGKFSYLVPCGSGNESLTSVPTYVANVGVGSKPRVRATFVSEQEWNEEVLDKFANAWALKHEPVGLDDTTADELVSEKELRALWDTIASVYDLDPDFATVAPGWEGKGLMLPSRFSDDQGLLLGRIIDVPCGEAESDQRERLKFFSIQRNSCAAVVARIDITGDFPQIPLGILVLDLPGSNDAVLANSRRVDLAQYNDCIALAHDQWVVKQNEVPVAKRLTELLKDEDGCRALFINRCENKTNGTYHRWNEVRNAAKVCNLLGYSPEDLSDPNTARVAWKRAWLCAAVCGFTGSMQNLASFLDKAVDKKEFVEAAPFYHVTNSSRRHPLRIHCLHDGEQEVVEVLRTYAQECETRLQFGVQEFRSLLELLQAGALDVTNVFAKAIADRISDIKLEPQFFKDLRTAFRSIDLKKFARDIMEGTIWGSAPPRSVRAALDKNIRAETHYLRQSNPKGRFPMFMPGDLSSCFSLIIRESQKQIPSCVQKLHMIHKELEQRLTSEERISWAQLINGLTRNRLLRFVKLFLQRLHDQAQHLVAQWFVDCKDSSKAARSKSWPVKIEEILQRLSHFCVCFVDEVESEFSRAFRGFAAEISMVRKEEQVPRDSVLQKVLQEYESLFYGGINDNIATIVRKGYRSLDKHLAKTRPWLCPLTNDDLLPNGRTAEFAREFNGVIFSKRGLLSWYRRIDLPVVADPLGQALLEGVERDFRVSGFLPPKLDLWRKIEPPSVIKKRKTNESSGYQGAEPMDEEKLI